MAENREQIIRTEYSEIMQKSYIEAGTAQNAV